MAMLERFKVAARDKVKRAVTEVVEEQDDRIDQRSRQLHTELLDALDLLNRRLDDLTERFDTRAEAEAYAKSKGLDYIVTEPKPRAPNVRPRGYGENFATDRRLPWTH